MWALNAALAAGAAALYLEVGALPAPITTVGIPWSALALAFAVTEISVVHVHSRRSSHTLAFGELPLVVGLLLRIELEHQAFHDPLTRLANRLLSA